MNNNPITTLNLHVAKIIAIVMLALFSIDFLFISYDFVNDGSAYERMFGYSNYRTIISVIYLLSLFLYIILYRYLKSFELSNIRRLLIAYSSILLTAAAVVRIPDLVGNPSLYSFFPIVHMPLLLANMVLSLIIGILLVNVKEDQDRVGGLHLLGIAFILDFVYRSFMQALASQEIFSMILGIGGLSSEIRMSLYKISGLCSVLITIFFCYCLYDLFDKADRFNKECDAWRQD